MNKKKIIEFFKDSVNKERKNKKGYTYWQALDTIDEKEFAIVLGWRDGFDTEDGYELCMKLAYKHTNSLMSEYDMDWFMPYDEETGEVYNNEVTVETENDIAENVD